MQLTEFYRKAIHYGKACDPRGKQASFPDSKILYRNKSNKIATILAGVDIGVGEIMLAENLRQQGTKIDLIVAHHPHGKALHNLHLLLTQHVALLQQFGIRDKPKVLQQKALELQLKIREINCQREIDLAKILNLPLICLHSPADNIAYKLIASALIPVQKKTMRHALTKLNSTWPNLQPLLVTGNINNQLGNFYLDIIGGQPLPDIFFPMLKQAGVTTLIAMHIDNARIAAASNNNLNLIALAHIAVDALALNSLIDLVTKQHPLTIIKCGGLSE